MWHINSRPLPFFELFDQKNVVKVGWIDHPMCPRFHTDKLKCYLVTPYVDPTTQRIPHHLVIRSKLRYGNGGKPDS